jgi:hypothetical protein
MVVYEGNQLTVSRYGSNKDYNYEAGELFELARFRVKADGATISLNGFTLKNGVGQGVKALELHDYLDKAEVTIGGEAVK